MIARDEARRRDAADPLAQFRQEFAAAKSGSIYLDANSVGAMPKAAPARIEQLLLEGWVEQRRRGWSWSDWLEQPRSLGAGLAHLIGAGPDDVLVCDNTTINLFKLLNYALQVARPRRTVVLERHMFPTDSYVAQGIAHASDGKVQLRFIDGPDDLEAAVRDDTAVAYLSLVDYRDSRRWDMAAVNQLARTHGALTLWDLSHAAGAIAVDLAGTGADFAVGCGYKYLSGGPGAPAFLSVASRHLGQLRMPLTGWFGHAQPFAFEPGYRAAEGIARTLVGTPPILSLAALEVGVDVMLEASIGALREKSIRQGELFIELVELHREHVRCDADTRRHRARTRRHHAIRHSPRPLRHGRRRHARSRSGHARRDARHRMGRRAGA
mgnify:CR=1 FL=1